MKVPELNKFESRIWSSLNQLQVEKDFCDVTIACEDQQIETHKMILAGGSLLFKNLLKENPCRHPFIYLPGIKFFHLSKTLDFLYQGEVKIGQNELDDLLCVAHDLKISGLKDLKAVKHSVKEGSKSKRLQLVSSPIKKDLNDTLIQCEVSQWKVDDSNSKQNLKLKLKLKKVEKIIQLNNISPQVWLKKLTLPISNDQCSDDDGKKDVEQENGNEEMEEKEEPLTKKGHKTKAITPSTNYNDKKDVEMKKLNLTPRVMLEKMKLPESYDKTFTKPLEVEEHWETKALEELFTNSKSNSNDQTRFPSCNQNGTGRLRIRDIASLLKDDNETDDCSSGFEPILQSHLVIDNHTEETRGINPMKENSTNSGQKASEKFDHQLTFPYFPNTLEIHPSSMEHDIQKILTIKNWK